MVCVNNDAMPFRKDIRKLAQFVKLISEGMGVPEAFQIVANRDKSEATRTAAYRLWNSEECVSYCESAGFDRDSRAWLSGAIVEGQETRPSKPLSFADPAAWNNISTAVSWCVNELLFGEHSLKDKILLFDRIVMHQALEPIRQVRLTSIDIQAEDRWADQPNMVKASDGTRMFA
jgi:hypothetical protein